MLSVCVLDYAFFITILCMFLFFTLTINQVSIKAGWSGKLILHICQLICAVKISALTQVIIFSSLTVLKIFNTGAELRLA